MIEKIRSAVGNTFTSSLGICAMIGSVIGGLVDISTGIFAGAFLLGALIASCCQFAVLVMQMKSGERLTSDHLLVPILAAIGALSGPVLAGIVTALFGIGSWLVYWCVLVAGTIFAVDYMLKKLNDMFRW